MRFSSGISINNGHSGYNCRVTGEQTSAQFRHLRGHHGRCGRYLTLPVSVIRSAQVSWLCLQPYHSQPTISGNQLRRLTRRQNSLHKLSGSLALYTPVSKHVLLLPLPSVFRTVFYWAFSFSAPRQPKLYALSTRIELLLASCSLETQSSSDWGEKDRQVNLWVDARFITIAAGDRCDGQGSSGGTSRHRMAVTNAIGLFPVGTVSLVLHWVNDSAWAVTVRHQDTNCRHCQCGLRRLTLTPCFLQSTSTNCLFCTTITIIFLLCLLRVLWSMRISVSVSLASCQYVATKWTQRALSLCSPYILYWKNMRAVTQ